MQWISITATHILTIFLIVLLYLIIYIDDIVIQHATNNVDACTHCAYLFLDVAGIDTTKFHCHSTRAASTSYVADANVNISSILEAVGWSNEHTFQKFYYKPCAESSFNLGSAVLDTYVHQG